MPDWSIMFVSADKPTPDKKADFIVDRKGAKRNAQVQVFNGDIVSWNNTTGDQHQPAVDNGDGTTTNIGGLLQQHKSSPGYAVGASPGQTVRFFCTQHKGEVGFMIVVEPGQPPGPPPSV